MNIEVEIRSFISKEKYEELLKFFHQEGEFVSKDEQETHYFDTKEDLRIQKNDFFSKIWLKKGKIHDECREEIEIKFNKEDFNKIQRIFEEILNIKTNIKWFRIRNTFTWQGIGVYLDYTKGYGYILELEKITSEHHKDEALQTLKEKLKILNIPLTPKEEFNNKYEFYKKNWETLIRS